MKRPSVALGLILFAATPVVGQTETDFTFSAGAGVAAGFPVGDFAEGDDVETGFGFTVVGRVHISPMIAVYGEFARFSFGWDVDEPGVDADITDSGFSLGGELWIPTTGQLTPLLRAGAIYNRAELNAADGSSSVNFESDRSLGFEVGAGLAYEVGEGLQIVPMARYRAFSPEFDIFGETGDTDITYATAGLSLVYTF